MKTPPVFVSCALPYANGSLHIGHVAALLPADILARFYSLKGNDVLFVSGSDTHGTPISVRAEKERSTPEELANRYHKEFKKNFNALGFSFEAHGLYTSTHTTIHEKLVQDVFVSLYRAGYIIKKTELAMYDEEAKRFLPDRFIEGTCPHCLFEDARGDQCDTCGRLLDPKDLLNPISKLTQSTPKERETEHFYLRLSDKGLQDKLKQYLSSIKHLRKNTKNYTQKFLEGGLHDRAITRDLDWGVPIPREVGEYPTKRIYVWMEAVLGYLSASKEWAQNTADWEKFWLGKDVQSYFVYGKDNIPFHTVILPALLIAYCNATKIEYHLPDIHVASEYVQIEGKKISTSRDWAVWVPDLLKTFSQDAIRYMLIASNPETADTNFSFKDFQAKYNNDLIATLGNLVQRVHALAKKQGISRFEIPKNLFAPLYDKIEKNILRAEFRLALQNVVHFAAEGNKQLDEHAPWKTIKQNPERAKKDLISLLGRVAQFGVLLEPFLPAVAKKIRVLFGVTENISWSQLSGMYVLSELSGQLLPKIEDDQIELHESKLHKKQS